MTPDLLYSRVGCHLCEDAEAALDALNWPYTRTEIGGDLELERLYGWHVPVLVRGGKVLLKGVITRSRLLELTGPDRS
ncbi:glutaredoxin family protein [Deinococcus radiomollis]|uniref:glutaredoxin family protein n=1 Tax=Deinococcus radiomollis TaxID=468916 RepID=UPI003892377B